MPEDSWHMSHTQCVRIDSGWLCIPWQWTKLNYLHHEAQITGLLRQPIQHNVIRAGRLFVFWIWNRESADIKYAWTWNMGNILSITYHPPRCEGRWAYVKNAGCPVLISAYDGLHKYTSAENAQNCTAQEIQLANSVVKISALHY